MLDGQIGKSHASAPAAAVAWVDEPRADCHRTRHRDRVDQVPEPIARHRIHVIVQEADQVSPLATATPCALASENDRLRSFRTIRSSERRGERLRELGGSVRRAIVDENDLEILVRGSGNSRQTTLQVLPSVVVQDNDRDQRTAIVRSRNGVPLKCVEERKLRRWRCALPSLPSAIENGSPDSTCKAARYRRPPSKPPRRSLGDRSAQGLKAATALTSPT